MKTITILALFAATLSFAQQPQSFLDEIQPQPIDSSTDTAIIESVNGNAVVSTYSTLTEFQADVTSLCVDDTLTSENFEGGPNIITLCGPSIGSFGSICFDPGVLEEGFVIESSDLDLLVLVPAGALANVEDPLVGANKFFYHTIVKYDPEVYAAAMDIWVNVESVTQIRIFGVDDELLEIVNLTTPLFTQTFFGVIANEPIQRIEIEGAHNGSEVIGNFLFGALCDNITGIEDSILSKISIFPNPTEGIINLNVPDGIELQNIEIYDVSGRLISNEIANKQVDVSQLTQGIYLFKLTTSEGIVTRKISKK